MAHKEVEQLRADASKAGKEFSGKTMPSMRDRLLKGTIEVGGGRVSAHVPLSTRQKSTGLTYLSSVEKEILRMASDAQMIDDPVVIFELLGAMKEKRDGIEALSPEQLSKKSAYAGLFEELSVLRLGGESLSRLGDFVSEILPEGAKLILYPEKGSSGIYLASFKNMVGSFSVTEIETQEGWFQFESTRIHHPVLHADYRRTGNSAVYSLLDLNSVKGDFSVVSLGINVTIGGESVKGKPSEHMARMFAKENYAFPSFLDTLFGHAIDMGISRREVEDCANPKGCYAFTYRSLETTDAPPSRENGFRETLVEAKVTLGPFKGDFENGSQMTIEGKITQPDGRISIKNSTERESFTYVYNRKENDFKLEG